MNEKTNKIFFIVILLAILVGLGVSIHLFDIDYKVTFDNTYTPGCDISETVSCSKVAESDTAYISNIPVASLGILGYLLVFLYMLVHRKKKYLYNHLLLFFSIFSAVSIYYFYIAKSVLNAICIYCSITYGINWILTILLLIIVFKLQNNKFSLKELFSLQKFEIPMYLVFSLLILVPSKMIFTQEKVESSLYAGGTFDSEKLVGIAGAKNADVTVVLYSDYECPYCSRFEESVKEMLTNFTNVKLIRKEFPLDNKCNPILGNKKFHEYACDAAYFAKCAGKEGKFWQAANLLHHKRKNLEPDSLKMYIKKLSLNKKKMETCMKSKEIKDAVLANIVEGVKLKVRGTPSFTINGKFNSGAYKYEKLKEILIKEGGKLKEISK